MATLKICTQTRTRWLPDMRSVERLGSFDTPSEYRQLEATDPTTSRKARREKDEAIVRAAIDACGDDMAAGIQLAEFWDEEVGEVLRLQQRGSEDKIWVVPTRCCFLMSDAGKTIDRI